MLMRAYIFHKVNKARSVPSLLTIAAMAGVMAVGAFGSQAQAQSSYEMDNRLRRLENEIDTLNRAVYRGDMSGAPTGRSASENAAVEVRMQQMEGELREIRGLLEEQAHKIRVLRSDMERITNDILMQLPGDINPIKRDQNTQAPEVSRGTASAGSQNGVTTYRLDNGQQNNSPYNAGGSQQLGTYVESSQGNMRADAQSPAAMYDSAFVLVKNGQYDKAESSFLSFLEANPDHELAGNAKYWLGETYYVRGKFEQAARTFAEGYQKYPKGSKAADNLLKLGMSLAGLNKTKDACVALGQLEKPEFSSAGALVSRAKQEMKRLGC